MEARLIGRVGAICLTIAILGSMLAALPAEARQRLLITTVVGPAQKVPPGEFRVAHAKCPRGYYVISAGLQLGAIEPVSDFRASPRVWKSDGRNQEENFSVFKHRVQAVCISGRSGIAVRSVRSARGASSATAGGHRNDRRYIEQARRDYAKGIVQSS
jgi:hypothetical protein